METSEPISSPAMHFNLAVDITYGIICLVCFIIGTSGNIASFLYFWSKKRDISSTVYMMVTVTDTVISLMVLPVGISYLSHRADGPLFRSEYTCSGWVFLWGVAVRSSIFFVVCLCVTRTYSLMKPFATQKITYLVVVVVVYLLVQVGQWAGLSLMGVHYRFYTEIASCAMFVSESFNAAVFLLLEISQIITFVIPTFVVATSCILSALMLTRIRGEGLQSEQQQSKNRATRTILLFALLYGVCNVPLVVSCILGTYSKFTDGVHLYDFFRFDTQFYYETATSTLLLAANSAINPVLYFWRMPNVRKYCVGGIRRFVTSQHQRTDMTRVSKGSHVYDTGKVSEVRSTAELHPVKGSCYDVGHVKRNNVHLAQRKMKSVANSTSCWSLHTGLGGCLLPPVKL